MTERMIENRIKKLRELEAQQKELEAAAEAIRAELTDLLFSQVAETQPIPEIELPDDGTEYLDITGQYIPYDTSNMVVPDSIEVHVTAEHLLWVYLLGIVLCITAVTLASMPIVKMKPKNILSQMS